MSISTAKSKADILNEFIDYRLLDVHTNIPCRVTSVSGRSVDCQPLITTKYSDGKHDPYPELYDVPLLVLSANGGKASIKMPISIGDIVLVFMSERDVGGLIDSNGSSVSNSGSLKTHGLYPIGAFPCIFTNGRGEDIDTNNVVIQNQSSTIVIEPNGKITATTPSEFTVNASKAVFNCPIEVNGVAELKQSAVVTGGITDDGKDVGSGHTHSGVQTGTGNTGAPN